MPKIKIDFKSEHDELEAVIEDLIAFQKSIVADVNRFITELKEDPDPEECGGGSLYDGNYKLDLDLY